jgi:hypothetical protein
MLKRIYTFNSVRSGELPPLNNERDGVVRRTDIATKIVSKKKPQPIKVRVI